MRKKIYKARPISNIKHSSSYQVKGMVKRIRTDDYTEDWHKISLEVKQRDGFKCVCCPNTTKLEVHHILPLSRGGKTIKKNLITLCEICHKKRHRHL